MTHSTRSNSSRAMKYALPAALLLLLLAACVLLGRRYLYRPALMQEDYKRLATESYSGIYLSMYDPQNFTEEDFLTYRGLTVVDCAYSPADLREVAHYLNQVFSSGNAISNCYLGLDPSNLWKQGSGSAEGLARELEERLLPFLSAHPDISFEIILPAYPLSYWANCSEQESMDFAAACRQLEATLTPYDNCKLFFAADKHWIVANPDNYNEEMGLTEVVARKLFLFTYCDGQFRLNDETVESSLAGFAQLVSDYRLSPPSYPDLSELTIVFFGDSIIGNYEGSTSIPGVVHALSGAAVENRAIGGSSATHLSDEDSSFINVLTRYLESEEAAADSDSLVFVLNYGLNDYFSGAIPEDASDANREDTYGGALRTGILMLRAAYPSAQIVLAAPNFITLYENGTVILSENGDVLSSYIAVAEAVAAEEDILYLDVYHGLVTGAENAGSYLEDGTHLGEEGRYRYAELLIEFLENNGIS